MSLKLDKLATLVAESREGNRSSLEALIVQIQPKVFITAQRFLMSPADTEDAVQEILLKVVTNLSQFDGNSQFTTWVYRIACNHLLDEKKRVNAKYILVHTMDFDTFGKDLATGLSVNEADNIHQEILFAEIRISFTLAILQCLQPDLRMAYILGEVLELDHLEAAQAMDSKPGTFRKRLSRARSAVSDFMIKNCGLVQPDNACRCHRRVSTASKLGRIVPDNPVFAGSLGAAQKFPQVLETVRRLESTQRAAALYRLQEPPADFPDLWSGCVVNCNNIKLTQLDK